MTRTVAQSADLERVPPSSLHLLRRSLPQHVPLLCAFSPMLQNLELVTVSSDVNWQ